MYSLKIRHLKLGQLASTLYRECATRNPGSATHMAVPMDAEIGENVFFCMAGFVEFQNFPSSGGHVHHHPHFWLTVADDENVSVQLRSLSVDLHVRAEKFQTQGPR